MLVPAASGCQRRAARPGVAARVRPAPAMAASPPRPAPLPPRGKQITILYSSNLLGEYEPCG
jgi:hypothetical protein